MQSDDAPHLDDAIGLGKRKQVYQPSLAAALLKVAALLGLAGVLFWIVLLTAPRGLWWGPVIIVGISLTGVALIWREHRRGDGAAVYERGFVVRDGQDLLQVRWSEVLSLERRVTATWSYDGGEEQVDLFVRTQRDAELLIPGWLPGLNRFWSSICLETALSAIRSGRILEFGPFRVDARWLTVWSAAGVKSFEWNSCPMVYQRLGVFGLSDEIAAGVDGEEALHVRVGPDVHSDLIPDRAAFCSLCQELAGRASPRRGPA